jgi:dUTP pyrophosphatase
MDVFLFVRGENMRKLEKISYEQFKKDLGEYSSKELYESLILPNRHTSNSAGYDFHAVFDFILAPGEIVKIPTGIKVIMEPDEFFMIVVRSSMGFKYNVRMCNQIGIIDADYYNNEENEGHMWIAFQNEGKEPWIVKKGDRIAQGIFVKYLLVDNEDSTSEIRKGWSASEDVGRDNNE